MLEAFFAFGLNLLSAHAIPTAKSTSTSYSSATLTIFSSMVSSIGTGKGGKWSNCPAIRAVCGTATVVAITPATKYLAKRANID